MSDRPPSYLKCAAVGCCEDPREPDSSVALFRITPKGGPFAGLCTHHNRVANVPLKPEIQKIMEWWGK